MKFYILFLVLFISGSGFSAVRCEVAVGAVRSAGYSPKQLAPLESLVVRGLITQTDAKHIIETGDMQKIWRLHFDEENITESEADVLADIFISPELGEALGPEKIVEFKARGEIATKVIVQEREADDGDQQMALIDPVTRNTIGRLDFTVNRGVFHVDFIRIQTRYQGFGYAEILLEETIKASPKIKSISADLSGTNEAAIRRAMERMSIEEAVKKTPAGKSAIKLGFTKITIDLSPKTREDGSTYNEFKFTATKP